MIASALGRLTRRRIERRSGRAADLVDRMAEHAPLVDEQALPFRGIDHRDDQARPRFILRRKRRRRRAAGQQQDAGQCRQRPPTDHPECVVVAVHRLPPRCDPAAR